MPSPPPVPPKDIPPRRSSLESQSGHNERRRSSLESVDQTETIGITKRKGYMRPYPPPSFSSSAMHRHSVLALGKPL